MEVKICIFKLNNDEIIQIGIDGKRFAEIGFKIKKCIGNKLKVCFVLKSINRNFDNKIKIKVKKILLKWLENFKYHYLQWKKGVRWEERTTITSI